MTNGRKLRLASFTAIAVSLAGCGGGGGVASMPPAPLVPTPSPTPTPTPTPTAFSITAPARGTTAPGTAAIQASAGGPSFTNGATAATAFPLLQSAMVFGASSAGPDPTANASGGIATFSGGTLNLNVAAFQTVDPGFRYSSSGYADLDWTRVGYWGTGGGWWDYDDNVGRYGVFVAGYQTPAASIPTTGTATYAGLVAGAVFFPGLSPGTTHCACNIVALTGNAAFTANFGTRNVSGIMTGMMAGGAAWNDVAFNSTITGNSFSGTTNVASVPGGPASMSASATGTLEGRFFGPTAQEAGAVWTLFDGTNAAMGTLTGKHP